MRELLLVRLSGPLHAKHHLVGFGVSWDGQLDKCRLLCDVSDEMNLVLTLEL
jgi:hypothetical protein